MALSQWVRIGVFLMAYTISKIITVDHTKVGAINNTSQTDFSVGIIGDYSYLAAVANGGVIQNTTTFNGQTVPADLIFTSDIAGLTLLKWEAASYVTSSGHGAVEIWVKIPTLSHSVDTVFYMWAGNAAVTTYQGGAVGDAWDASSAAIFHTANGTTLSVLDSSANGNNGNSPGDASAITGQIDGGINFPMDVGNQAIQIASSSSMNLLSGFTISQWFKPFAVATGNYQALMARSDGATVDYGILLNISDASKINPSSGGPIGDTTLSSPIQAGVWQQIALTSNGTNAIVYLQGVNVSSTAWSSLPAASGSGIRFGGFFGIVSDAFPYKGDMDEVRFESVARSADWINTRFNNETSPSTFYAITTNNIASSGLLLSSAF